MAVRCETRSDLEAYGVALLILGGILVFLAFGAAMSAREGEGADSEELSMLALLGALYVFLASWVVLRIREWLALGDATLYLSTAKPRVGESFTCRIDFERNPQPPPVLRAELICQSTTRTGIGGKEKFKAKELWRDAKTSSTLRFAFHPPLHLPAAEKSISTEVRWWLRLRAAEGAGGLRRRFRVPVGPAASIGQQFAATGEFELPSPPVGQPRFSRAFQVLYGISALLFAAIVGLLVWGFGDEGLIDESPHAQVEGVVRLGHLRLASTSPLAAQLEGAWAWRPGSLELRANRLRMRASDCEGPCPLIEEIRVSLWHWAEEESGGASGTTVARTEPIAVGRALEEGAVLDLGMQTFRLKLRRDADPRQLALMLDVRTDKSEEHFGQRFGGAAHLFGLFQTPGDPKTCASAKTAITALEHFCQGKFAEMLSQVPGRERTRLLFLAIQRGNVDAVRALLAAEASVTATNYRGHTPLMVAAFAEQPEIVRMLLDAGADPNLLANRSGDDPGDIALGLALTAGALGSAQVLLEKGADPKAMHHGSPMLHVAVGADLAEALALLVKAGADVNARAAWGHSPTALMVAAGTGKSALISQLLELNADPAVADSDGHTARDYAATHKKPEALERLKSFPGRCAMTGC